jgi:hypothetical protein
VPRRLDLFDLPHIVPKLYILLEEKRET